jgi:MFS family permease
MSLPIFEEILDNKIGFGYYQKRLIPIAGLIYAADMSEITALSLLLPILKTEWDFSLEYEALLGTVLFFGMFVGGLIAGYVADKYGRRKALLYSSSSEFCIGIISAFIHNSTIFIILRGIFGVLIGFTIPLTTVSVSEITPRPNRGKSLGLLNLGVSIGQVYALFVAWITLDDLSSGNWRLMLVVSSIPSLLLWFCTWQFTYESPRYHIVMGEIEASCEILNKIGTLNKGDQYIPITEEEKEQLRIWSKSNFNSEEVADWKELLNDEYRKITYSIWVFSWALNVLFYGLIFILPFIIGSLNIEESGMGGIAGYAIVTLGDLPALAVLLYLVDHPKFGRKNSLIASFIGCIITFIIAFIMSNSWIIEVLSLSKGFIQIGFNLSITYTAEIYPTSYRALGLGVGGSIGKLGAVMSPTLCIWAFDTGAMIPLLLFAAASLIGLIASYLLPFDTRTRIMDTREEGLLTKGTEPARRSVQLVL